MWAQQTAQATGPESVLKHRTPAWLVFPAPQHSPFILSRSVDFYAFDKTAPSPS